MEDTARLFTVSQAAAQHIYNALISTLQMDMGSLATTPRLMINEQHLEPHVLPSRSSDISFRPQHFVSSVKNELLCVVHYNVPQPELSHAYSCSLSLVLCLYPVWVSVSVWIKLTYQDSYLVKCTTNDMDFTAIWDHYKERERESYRGELDRVFTILVADTLKAWPSRKPATFLLWRPSVMTMVE